MQRSTITALLGTAAAKRDTAHLEHARASYAEWTDRQHALVDPDGGEGSLTGRLLAKLRPVVENPSGAIRPEVVAAAIDEIAGADTV